jgi:hypothetical protein
LYCHFQIILILYRYFEFNCYSLFVPIIHYMANNDFFFAVNYVSSSKNLFIWAPVLYNSLSKDKIIKDKAHWKKTVEDLTIGCCFFDRVWERLCAWVFNTCACKSNHFSNQIVLSNVLELPIFSCTIIQRLFRRHVLVLYTYTFILISARRMSWFEWVAFLLRNAEDAGFKSRLRDRLSKLKGFVVFYQPQMIYDVCWIVGGMRISRGNRSTRRKPAPVLLSLPQIKHDLTWTRTLAAEVGSRRLTASVMARPA